MCTQKLVKKKANSGEIQNILFCIKSFPFTVCCSSLQRWFSVRYNEGYTYLVGGIGALVTRVLDTVAMFETFVLGHILLVYGLKSTVWF